ncbi:MAG: glycosyltransferase family 2 protein [Candidatus Parvarchaeota archaeon]|nr:glycosyltransferase family 2 protein [Candidatus Jingweiarchaeum tengchongense]MCW1305086.1 glycosyltransferase family 2 protein [Candidatus Jingweiarchaeum tengchongense]MCW1305148.1 glycosyltransferase family 2 protein [Candidatus Jingweiarchaeum tengchongense]MCW1310744.1 glycosyltransferase family 2 protein [Candidatus Jingweiarchaeum tengchongense]
MISIVVPCYNEEKNIEKCYRDITTELIKLGIKDYEIIFEQEGSTDRTLEIMKKIEKLDKRVIALDLGNKRKGKGFGLRACFEKAHGELIITMDADLSVKPDIIKKFMDESKENDIIIASRFIRGGESRRPILRNFLSFCYNLISRILLNVDVRDAQSGFKAIKKEVIKNIELKIDGFEIDTELLAKAKKMGFRIKEVPATWIQAKESKVNPIIDSLKMLKGLIKIWYELKIVK